MSENFTASNGIQIEYDHNYYGKGRARMATLDSEGENMLTGHDRMGTEEVQALREFFQHERDEELGRWRSQEDPLFVAYRKGPHARIVNEASGESEGYIRRNAGTFGPNPFSAVAEEYWDAHPESKPWHDAKPGEVWELTYHSPSHREATKRVMTCVDDGGNISFFNEVRLHTVQFTGIESARRIWPEDE
ncbi:hypothetical protein MUN77_01450 [Leucobacter allii]|uniref:hypothetical protein n=1 Tax=Leucobacter allii TaxID=2932247 RepID=UPI001FCFB1CD|nr:hypothetical protein [Leucobacter allii]UOR02024.1 hypothetical protein MUN77_01450 [Leucobacter allii]